MSLGSVAQFELDPLAQPASNTPSLRIGRPASNTITSSWVTGSREYAPDGRLRVSRRREGRPRALQASRAKRANKKRWSERGLLGGRTRARYPIYALSLTHNGPRAASSEFTSTFGSIAVMPFSPPARHKVLGFRN
jgi:hypothetical protein